MVTGVLVGPGVFQLQGDERDAVDKQHHVDLLLGVLRRVGHLAGTAKEVGGKVLVHSRTAAGQRGRVHQGQVGIVKAQPFFQQVQHPLFLHDAVETLQYLALPVMGVMLLELGQLRGLGGLEKLPE